MKSVVPFEVVLSIPHLFSKDLEAYKSIKPVSEAMGAFFGWIDDIVDYEKDLKSGKRTSVEILLQNQKEHEQIETILLKETHRRFNLLLNTLEDNGLQSMKEALQKAISLWVSVF